MNFGWNVPLFQRPQHISKNLAKQNCLVLYEVTTMTDKVKDISGVEDNLYLVNFNNGVISNIIFNKLKNIKANKYIEFYSTDYRLSVKDIKQYIEDGFKIIYEYIDDLSPKIVGTNDIPKNMKEKYEYMINDTENVFVVVTADKLEEDIKQKRGTEKLTVSSNGVDYSHFKNIDNKFVFEKEYIDLINTNKPIIGYYGAMASWFDYNLIKYLAQKRKNYNIVLIGIKYDDTFEKSGLNEIENIHYIGAKDYFVLQNYANKFSVCTIPFKINSITKATSPVKLFEYMALGKPIVTTAMDECKKYKSVMIANDMESYVEQIDKAVNMNNNNNEQYFSLLEKEAKENTWDKKAYEIIKLINKYE